MAGPQGDIRIESDGVSSHTRITTLDGQPLKCVTAFKIEAVAGEACVRATLTFILPPLDVLAFVDQVSVAEQLKVLRYWQKQAATVEAEMLQVQASQSQEAPYADLELRDVTAIGNTALQRGPVVAAPDKPMLETYFAKLDQFLTAYADGRKRATVGELESLGLEIRLRGAS